MGLMPGGVSYDQKVLGYGPIAYWPLWELSGTTAQCLVNPAQNGTYSGVTLGQEGIGDGGQAPLFDGANDYVDIYSAALAAIFPYDEGSFCGWMKVFNVGVWSDGAVRIFISAAAALGGAAFMVNFYRRGVVNNVTYFRDDGADNQVLQHVVVAPVTDWQHFALTWSVASGNLNAYIASAQIGASQPGVLAHVGADINADMTAIGIGSIGASTWPWHGWLARCAIFGRVLTLSEIEHLATV